VRFALDRGSRATCHNLPAHGVYALQYFYGVFAPAGLRAHCSLGLHFRSFVTTTKPQLSLNHNLKSVPLVLTGNSLDTRSPFAPAASAPRALTRFPGGVAGVYDSFAYRISTDGNKTILL
jgi:hypothetical protein